MKDLLPFLTQHWLLAFLLAGLVGAYLIYEARLRFSGVQFLTPSEVVQLINRDNVSLFDIRSESAFHREHILGSQLLRKEVFASAEEFQKSLSNPNKKIVLVCELGQTAFNKASLLSKWGYKNVGVLQGGLRNWNQANLPLERSS